MKITASEVNKLRQSTGAGMMDCKKALVEAEGDFEAAVDLLRKKGQKVAAKRSDRDATEGLVLADATNDGSNGALIVLNCETDFVARNADFGAVAQGILNVAMNSKPSSLEDLKALPYPESSVSIADKLTEETGKIGEKIELSAYQSISAGQVVAYNHPGNQLAALVGFNNDAPGEVGKDVAMQIAAMAPVSLDEDSVPADVVSKELEIAKELAIQEGKPAEMADKIAQGRLKKFFKEATLLNQPFIKDNKKSIKQYLSENGSDLTVTEFCRMTLN